MPVPALPPYLIEPIWQQFSALIPQRQTSHPLGCHRPRIPDRVIFEKLVQVLVFGCAYKRIADGMCSATTLRERRDEWIELGAMDALRGMRSKPTTESSAWNSRMWRWTAASRRPLAAVRSRRREGGQEPGGQGKAGHQTLDGSGRRSRHPLGHRYRPG